MSGTLRFVLIVAIAIYFLLLLYLLKRNSLNLKYTLLWILSGCIMVVTVISPNLLKYFADMVGIYNPVNALFSIVCFCILMILMSLTAIVSKMKEQNKRLSQSVALLENKLRNLKNNN